MQLLQRLSTLLQALFDEAIKKTVPNASVMFRQRDSNVLGVGLRYLRRVYQTATNVTNCVQQTVFFLSLLKIVEQ